MNDFLSGCGSRQAALRRISDRDPGSIALLRRRVAEQPTPAGAKAREAERIYRLGKRIVEGFLLSLISGKRVATGFQPPSIQRIAIPGELWSELTPNFEHGTAKDDGYAFTHIRVSEATNFSTNLTAKEPEVVKRMEAWLGQRRDQYGDELKKVLRRAAQDEFGSEFKSRVFDAAYSLIYGRKRGRPRRSQGR